jgi:hypothetical protein
LSKQTSKSIAKRDSRDKPHADPGEQLVIGLDSEWVTRESEAGEKFNHVLSYQAFCISVDGKSWGLVLLTTNGVRKKLHEVLVSAIKLGIKQGHLSGYPKRVSLVAHNAAADMVHLSDWHRLKNRFDGLKKTYTTLVKPVVLNLYDKSRNVKKTTLSLYDTMLMAPAGRQKLGDLGDLLGIPKIELPKGMIENMDLLLASDRELFERYALTDAEIAAKYYVKRNAMALEMTESKKVQLTTGSLATNYTMQYFANSGVNAEEFLGYETVKSLRWDDVNKRQVSFRKRVPTEAAHLHLNLATESFHGGRNECYFFGATPQDIFTDYDLCGAYTTALAAIKTPDYENARVCRDPHEYLYNVLGIAQIEFEFPKDSKFPCLPVRTPYGLIFPLKGRTCVPSPEIYLALKMGADIVVRHGIIIPWKTNVHPFSNLIAEIQKNRKRYQKGSFEELNWKEIGNSIYGKLAQGLAEKRVFDTREGQHRDMPPSRLTNPYLAAYTTSLVRAALSEILALIPRDRLVVSATTDGLLTNATPGEIEQASIGPVCSFLSRTRYEMLGDAKILEVKHQAAQVLAWRTRGQATVQEVSGSIKLLAKAGIKPPAEIPVEGHCSWIADLFVNRTGTTTIDVKQFPSLLQLHTKGGDYIPEDRTIRLSMEFDWKRTPIRESATEREIMGIPHLAFKTLPWAKVEDFLQEREEWKLYWDKCNFPLKTVRDFENYSHFRIAKSFKEKGIKRSKNGGEASTMQAAIRVFVRAFAQQEWGLQRTMTISAFSELMTANGYRVTVQDVKNGSNRKLPDNAVPRTPAVEAFVVFVKKLFPSFEEHKFWFMD